MPDAGLGLYAGDGKDLALCACMICGREVPAFRYLCARCRHRFGLPESFAAWPEWAQDLRRHHSRRRYYERQLLAHYDRRDPDEIEWRLGDSADMDALIEPEPALAEARAALAWTALQQMKRPWAEAFLLVAWQELSFSEAGRTLGLSHNGAHYRYEKARAQLKEVLS